MSAKVAPAEGPTKAELKAMKPADRRKAMNLPQDNPKGPPKLVHPYKAGGDRATEHQGLTGSTKILYDAEVKDPTCHEMIPLALTCRKMDVKRSYIYLRENSIERNVAVECLCPLPLCKKDLVTVEYFDKIPFKRPIKKCGGMCPSEYPRVEFMQPGYTCCGTNLRGCGGLCETYYAQCDPDRVVVMPSEMCPCPCCCQANRITMVDNCFDLCGPVSGNPKFFYPFSPQPKDPKAFVAVCHEHMIRD